MYKQYYQDYFTKCFQELKATENVQIKKLFKTIRKDFKDDDFDCVIQPFVSVLINDIIPYVEKEDIEDTIIGELDEFIKATKYMRKAYVLDIHLIGQKQNCWRTLQIPATLVLSELCYAIMSVFCCDGGHLFSIEYKKKEYYCDAYSSDFQDVEYVSDEIIPCFNLRKGSHMIMTYDFGDNFMFDIRVKEVKDFHYRLSYDDIQLLDGKGYGIWEDDHYLMELYHNDPKRFKDVCEENGYDEEYFPIDEEFDLALYNEEIINDMNRYINIYERNDIQF